MSLYFFKEAIKDPKNIGAIIPASKHLSKRIAHEAIKIEDALVVEIGCGCGAITEALSLNGTLMKAIEINEKFVEMAKNRVPAARIIHGDAATIDFNSNHEANVVVCSVPFLSIDNNIRVAILDNIKKNMPNGFTFINYSYNNNLDLGETNTAYSKISSERVLFNFPPAFIHSYLVNSCPS